MRRSIEAAWVREITEVDAIAAASKLAPRPLLVLHGSDDDVAPLDDARLLVEAHGDAELRIVALAGRRLRHDPRRWRPCWVGWIARPCSVDPCSPTAWSQCN